MYTIKFIRAGQHGKDYNMKARGAFTKRFRTLSEIVKYVTSSTDILFAEPWSKWENMTDQEKHILKMKLHATLEKRNRRIAKRKLEETREKLTELGIKPKPQVVKRSKREIRNRNRYNRR